MSIIGNMIGAYSTLGKTLTITDEGGLELTGVIVDKEVIFTANADTDIREGKVAATEQGVVTGGKRIPLYETSIGNELIFPDSDFEILSLSTFDQYDFTYLQCIITRFDTDDINDSTFAEKIVINDGVYNVQDSIKISDITKDSETKSIRLNIKNNTENIYLIRYVSCKEEL